MADIPISQVMNDMGHGDMALGDFVDGIISSITGKVGKAEAYGKEKTQQQKKLEEQLRHMEKLTDGLEDVVKTVQDLKKTIDDTKKKSSSSSGGGGTFSNVMSAIGKIFSSGIKTEISSLEEKTLHKLSKMADEAVKGHSLHVHDYTVAGKMDLLIREVHNLGYILATAHAKKLKQRGYNSNTPGSASNTPTANTAAGLNEVNGLNEAKGLTESLEVQGDLLNKEHGTIEDIGNKLGVWAKKLKISAPIMESLVKSSQAHYGFDLRKMNLQEKALDYLQKLDRQSKHRIQMAALEYETAVRNNAPMEQQIKLMNAFADATLDAGAILQSNIINKLGVLQNKIAAVLNIMRLVDPSVLFGGPQLNFSITNAAQQSAELMATVGQATYAAGGFVGDITQAAGTWHNRVLRDFGQTAEFASQIGVASQDMRALYSRGLRRGMIGDFRTVAETGAALSRQIGANTESTADELNTWVLRYRLTNIEARNLATNITAVGRQTGITGDNLLNAVRSAGQLADQMRAAGNFTQGAGRTLIQISAVAQRMGTERITNPLIEGLMTRQGFMNMNPAFRSFIGNAGQRGGLSPGAMANGEVMNNPAMQRQLLAGMKLRRDEFRAMIRDNPGSLGLVNSTIEQNSGGLYRGLGELELGISSFEEGIESVDQKIARLTRELAANTNATESQRQSIQDQIDAARTGRLTNILQDFSLRLGQSGTIDSALAPGQTHDDIREALRERARLAGVSSLTVGGQSRGIEDAIVHAMSSGLGFNRVVEALGNAEILNRGRQNQSTDPATKFRNHMMRFANDFFEWANNIFETVLDRVPVGALANLALLGGISATLMSIMGLVSTFLSGVGTILGPHGLGVLFGSGAGGAAGAGGGAAGGGAAAAAAGGGALAWAAAVVLPLLGGIMGFMQSEEAKRNRVEGTILGALTGGARTGSILSPRFGNAAGSQADQTLGVGQAALFGGASGALIGSAIAPGVGTVIGGAIGAVLGIGGEVYKLLTDETSAFFSQGFVDAIEKLKGGIGMVWDGLVSFIGGLWGGIVNIFEGIGSIFSQLWEGMGPDVIYFFDEVMTGLIDLFAWGAPYLKQFGDFLGWMLKDVIGFGLKVIFSQIVGPAFKGIGMVIGTVFRTIGAVIQAVRTGTGPFVDGLKRIGDFFVSMGVGFYDNIIQPIVDGWERLKNGVGVVVDWIGDKWERFKNGVGVIVDWIVTKWDDMKNAIGRMIDWIIDHIPGGRAVVGNTRAATVEEVRQENAARAVNGQAPLPVAPGAVQVNEPGVVGGAVQNLREWNTNNPFINGMDRIGGFFRGLNPFAEGTREIQRTGLGLLHQGEMVVPASIARHLTAEGNGPFNDAIAIVRPGNNDAMMRRRIETEFSGSSTESASNRTLDNINDYNRQQTEMMRQQLEYLRQLLVALTTPREGAARGDTSPNSRPAPPPQYFDWAIRPLNQPNYGGVENHPRG